MNNRVKLRAASIGLLVAVSLFASGCGSVNDGNNSEAVESASEPLLHQISGFTAFDGIWVFAADHGNTSGCDNYLELKDGKFEIEIKCPNRKASAASGEYGAAFLQVKGYKDPYLVFKFAYKTASCGAPLPAAFFVADASDADHLSLYPLVGKVVGSDDSLAFPANLTDVPYLRSTRQTTLPSLYGYQVGCVPGQ